MQKKKERKKNAIPESFIWQESMTCTPKSPSRPFPSLAFNIKKTRITRVGENISQTEIRSKIFFFLLRRKTMTNSPKPPSISYPSLALLCLWFAFNITKKGSHVHWNIYKKVQSKKFLYYDEKRLRILQSHFPSPSLPLALLCLWFALNSENILILSGKQEV